VEGCQSLTLAIDHRFDVVCPGGEDWLSAFTRLHNIESVYLHDLAAVGFIGGLRMLRSRTQSPKLSSLRKLEFHHANLDMMIETEVRDDVGGWVASQALAIDILADALLKGPVALDGTWFDLVFDRCCVTMRPGMEEDLKSHGITLHQTGHENTEFWDT
jgi:hypothetical protein